MHEDYEYVKSLEKEVDELESEKADFSNMYDLLLEECVSKDVICSYLHSLSELNAHTELQCMYLHKVKECECLAQKLSKQTESVNNEVHNKLLKSFAKLEKHSISLELSLQHCKEQMKNNPVCKENASNVFRKEREQYHEIQDLKAQMQDKNMSVTACNDSSKSKTLNVNAVCAECGKCVFNSNHDACVSRYLKDVNARTKKPKASFLRQKASDYDNSDPVPPRQMLLLTCREDRLLTTRVRISLQSLLEEYYNLTQQKLVSVVQEIGESCSRDIDITKMHSFHPQVMIIEGPERSSFRNKVHGKSQHIASSTRTTFAISLNDELHQSRQTKRLGTSRQTMWQDDFKDKVVYGRKTKRMKDHTVIGKQKLDL
ncbi:hypothetical protein Tco_0351253 [Tanacetum coccineum]